MGPVTRGKSLTISVDRVAIPDRECARCLALCARFCPEPSFHTEEFHIAVCINNILRVCGHWRIALHQAPYLLRGAIWRQHPRAKLWIICKLCDACELCEWSRYLATAYCKGYGWAMVSWWPPSNGNIVEAREANFRCCRRGGVSSTCQLLRLLLSPLGPSLIYWSPRKRKIKISRSPLKLPWNFETARVLWRQQNRSLVEDSSFASAFTAQASPKWAESTCRHRFPDGISIRTIHSISFFVIVLALSASLNYLLSYLYLNLLHIAFSQITRIKMRRIRKNLGNTAEFCFSGCFFEVDRSEWWVS